MDTNALNKLAYFCDEKDGEITYSTYILYLNGRPVLSLHASKDEEGYPVYMSKPFTEIATKIKTKGIAYMDPENGHIDGCSMQAIAYKYMPWLLADLYVPQEV